MEIIKTLEAPAPQQMEGDIVNREFASSFNLSGEAVNGFTDKSFEIIKQRIEIRKDLDDPSKMIEKLILTVKLANGTEIEYYPNKTAQKTIIAKKGYRFSDWLGFKGKFYTEGMKVGKTKREVIYIED